MINDALDYPRTGDDWTRTVLIGGLLSLLGVLVVPTVLVAGYLVRVLDRTMHGDGRPPAFEKWGELLIDGVKGLVIVVAYGVVPAVVATVVVGGGILSFTVVEGSGAAGTAGGAGTGGPGIIVVVVGLLLAFVLTLLAAYVVPAALAASAETGRIAAAFSIGDLRPALLSGTYATAWLWAFAVVGGAGIIAGALSAIPVIGFAVGGFVGFYAGVSAAFLVGRAWGNHRDLGPSTAGNRPPT